MLGVMLGCTGITQLICPAIGYTSDRSTSRYGRRRPTMVAGALIACLGHCAMLACHHYRVGHLYLVSLTVAVFGMNCWCAAAATALPQPLPSPPPPPLSLPSPPATRPACLHPTTALCSQLRLLHGLASRLRPARAHGQGARLELQPRAHRVAASRT